MSRIIYIIGSWLLLTSIALADPTQEFIHIIKAVEDEYDLSRKLIEKIIKHPMIKTDYNRLEYEVKDQYGFYLTLDGRSVYFTYRFISSPKSFHKAMEKAGIYYKFKSTRADESEIYNYEARNFTIKLFLCAVKEQDICHHEARITKYNPPRLEKNFHRGSEIQF